MGALVCFRFLAGVGTFRTQDLLPRVVQRLAGTPATYQLGQWRYDLAKLLAKGLVLKVAGTQTYQLTPAGFRLSVLYLKLFHTIYAPLTAGTVAPEPGDARLPEEQRCTWDRLYAALDQALQALWEHLGIRIAG